MHIQHRISSFAALMAVASLTLVACGANTADNTGGGASATASETTTGAPITEGSTLSSRIALTYDGGIMVVDARTMEVIDTVEKDGFLRLNPSGDNRHMTVSDGSSYTVMDMGVWEQPHGDHSHVYTTKPSLTSLSFGADHTGHVITDNGRTAMFADGTGTFEVYDPTQLTGDNNYTATSIPTETVTLASPHHGFAIPLDNNRYLVSLGTEEERTGAAVVDAQGNIIEQNTECPGVHGEAIAANGVFTVGCQDGALIYRDGAFTKVSNPEDPYSRSGNQAGSADSDVVLADYKTDRDATLERPEQFSLIHTSTNERQKVQLPEGVSYTFRSLARGPGGEALLLTTDGKLRFYDQNSGEELGNIDLMDAWEESETWQDPRPALWVDGDVAYVTDPASKKLMAVSLKNIGSGSAEKFAELQLPETPNEISGVTGKAVSGAREADSH